MSRVNRIQHEVHELQRTLDAEADKLSTNMKIPRSLARRRIKMAWLNGCIICKKQGSTAIRLYKQHLYVLCADCSFSYKLEFGEKAFSRSIARRLARRAQSSQSKN